MPENKVIRLPMRRPSPPQVGEGVIVKRRGTVTRIRVIDGLVHAYDVLIGDRTELVLPHTVMRG